MPQPTFTGFAARPRRSQRRAVAGAIAATALSLGLTSLPVTGLAADPTTGGPAAAQAAEAAPYLVGAGVYDITGEAAESGMFGYAAQQEVNGLQQRLWSHAYVIATPNTDKRVAFVSADLGAMFQSVKLEVIKRLKAKYGDRYTIENVMLTASHTHVGSGGLSHYQLYAMAAMDGAMSTYSKANFEVAVDGIVKSIERADASLTPGSIKLTQGRLDGASKNRSEVAYNANPDAGSYADNVNKTMTMLTLTDQAGRDLGVINWFAVHNTSLSNKWTQLSGDNKGYAQQRFERLMGTKNTDSSGQKPFVAAFANSDEGDSVPTDGNAFAKPGYQGSSDELLNAERAGERQFTKALELYRSAGTSLDGTLDYRHRWANFEDYTVDGAFTGSSSAKLCAAARGVSFAAGAENGPSNIPGIYEGMTRSTYRISDSVNKVDQSFLGAMIRSVFGTVGATQQDSCQGDKYTLLSTGKANWVPEVLPFQIFRIGNLAIIGAPSEVTTMSGRRIRETVLQQLRGTGVDTAVIAGLANTYSGYLTTAEEFATQQYEGASTEFGPNTLAAYRQEYSRLAAALANGSPVTDDVQPQDKSGQSRASRKVSAYDSKWPSEFFGGTLSQPNASYTRGQTATVSFRGGHPKRDLMTMNSYLYVQQQVGSQWVNVLDDNDWETSYVWKTEPLSERSVNTISWRIGADTKPGTYRLFHQGYWKSGLDGKLRPYSGFSRSFTVS